MTKATAREFRECIDNYTAAATEEQRQQTLERAFDIFDRVHEETAGEPDPYKGITIEDMCRQLTEDEKLFFIDSIRYGLETGRYKYA